MEFIFGMWKNFINIVCNVILMRLLSDDTVFATRPSSQKMEVNFRNPIFFVDIHVVCSNNFSAGSLSHYSFCHCCRARFGVCALCIVLLLKAKVATSEAYKYLGMHVRISIGSRNQKFIRKRAHTFGYYHHHIFCIWNLFSTSQCCCVCMCNHLTSIIVVWISWYGESQNKSRNCGEKNTVSNGLTHREAKWRRKIYTTKKKKKSQSGIKRKRFTLFGYG